MVPEIALHWFVWAGLVFAAVAPRLFRRHWQGCIQAAARCVSWGLFPLFVAVLITLACDVLGVQSPFSMDVFNFTSPFSGYGLAVSLGLFGGVLGSYVPALDFAYGGAPAPQVSDSDVIRIAQSGSRVDSGHE